MQMIALARVVYVCHVTNAYENRRFVKLLIISVAVVVIAHIYRELCRLCVGHLMNDTIIFVWVYSYVVFELKREMCLLLINFIS